jgi:mannose/fructose-specific phosphotransferase system component IIA
MVKIILITHGDMARAMLDTASKIYPFDKNSVDAFTVSGNVDLQQLRGEIKQKVDPEGTLIMVDAFGGTACNVPAAATHGMGNVNVVCGLNLNMLLSALSNRGALTAAELARKVLEDGVKSVFNATERLQ